MRRRKQDSMEVQQMKLQAKEEKERRAFERMRLQRERQAREKAQNEKKQMEEILKKLQNDIQIANEALVRYIFENSFIQISNIFEFIASFRRN